MKRIISLVVLILTVFASANAQCPYDNVQYLTSAAPTTIGVPLTASTCLYGGEYRTVTGLVQGAVYRFETCGDTDFDTEMTIYPAGGGAALAFNDDFCGLQSSIDFTVPTAGSYDILIDGAGCTDVNTCMTLKITLLSLPPADNCANAQTITCGSTVTGSTVGMTLDGPATSCTGGSVAADVWYVFTGLGSNVAATLCGATNYDSKIDIYTGTCGAFTSVVCNDDFCGLGSGVNWFATAGTTYYIRVHGYNGGVGDFELALTNTQTNDVCANATAITAGTYAGTTVCMGADVAPTCTTTDGTGGGVWYAYTAATTCNVITASLCGGGTSYDSKIRVYEGTCGALTCVVGNDDFCGLQSQVSWNATAGTTYYILVHGYGTSSGAYSLTVSEGPDATAPVANVTTLPDVTAECEVTSLVAPTATDCQGTITGVHNATLPITTQGTTVVTWTYTDGSGNASTQTQNVVIDDVTAPTITCQSDITVSNDPGICGAVITFDAPGCGAPAEVYVNQLSVDHIGGNASNTLFPNTVADDFVIPVGDCWNIDKITANFWMQGVDNDATAFNIFVYNNNGGIPGTLNTSVVVPAANITPTFITNASGFNVYNLSMNLPSAINLCEGTYWLGVQAVNTESGYDYYWEVLSPGSSGLFSHENYTGPWQNTGSDRSFTIESQGSTGGEVSDNCSGCPTVTQTAGPVSGSTFPVGTTVVTFQATDAAGNSSTCSFNVIVEDTEGPAPDVVAQNQFTVNIYAGASYMDEASWTLQDEGGMTVASGGPYGSSTPGQLIATANVPVMDEPYIFFGETQGSFNDNIMNYEILCDGAIIANGIINGGSSGTATGLVGCAIPGGLPTVTASCEVASLTAPTATDVCGGAITGTTTTTFPITATTTVTWTYDDGNGNTTTQQQQVNIQDAVAPVVDNVTLADITAECEVTSLTAPTATDNCSGALTGTHNATLPINSQGLTVVTWTYTDGAGNTTTQTQNVILTDVTAPVADLATLADVTAECEVAALTAPTATDNCGGAVTVTHDATLPITTQGTTLVTWTYFDGNGNTSTQSQNVVIEDVTGPAPDAATLADISETCEVTALTEPTATDNCGGAVTVSHDATLPITAQGTTVVTWTYTDQYGNTTTQEQNVIITDNEAPVPTAASLPDIVAECEVGMLIEPAATDNCTLASTTYDVTLPITAQGTTVITWTFTDAAGNSSTQTQNVVIEDVSGPAPDLSDLPNVEATCQVDALTAPTATDNCGGVVTVAHDATLPIVADEIVTWTFTDENGNTTTQTQQVLISPVDATVTVNGTTITANNTNTGVTYQWIDCDNANQPIAGETGVSYTPTVTGNYAVEVTEGSCTEVSECTLIDFSGITQLNSEFIHVYPNPASTTLNITTSVEGMIDFYDVSGKLILSQKVKSGNNELNVSELATGTYNVRLTTDSGVNTVRVVINRQ